MTNSLKKIIPLFLIIIRLFLCRSNLIATDIFVAARDGYTDDIQDARKKRNRCKPT
jgi:hypothetical protein